MDIGQVVKYEKVHELKVTFPDSDRYLGLTIGVRNASSEAAKAAIRKQENERRTTGRNKQKRYTAENSEQDELQLVASCIAYWKWELGDASYKSLRAMDEARKAGKSEDEIEKLSDASEAKYNGDQPELNMDIAMEILDRVPFIYAQIKGASVDVQNFM